MNENKKITFKQQKLKDNNNNNDVIQLFAQIAKRLNHIEHSIGICPNRS